MSAHTGPRPPDLCDPGLSVGVAGPHWMWPLPTRRPQGAGGRDGTAGPLPCFLPPGWALLPTCACVCVCVHAHTCLHVYDHVACVRQAQEERQKGAGTAGRLATSTEGQGLQGPCVQPQEALSPFPKRV